jgi:hypothetical protein
MKIKDLLIEAQKRGFITGAKYKDIWNGEETIIDIVEWHEDSQDLRSNGYCIYHNGKWAEIISYKDDAVKTPNHYDNSKGSLYQFCENQNLNSYEFDIIKRVMRCRKKGNFKEDLEKTKFLIDLYLKEYEK